MDPLLRQGPADAVGIDSIVAQRIAASSSVEWAQAMAGAAAPQVKPAAAAAAQAKRPSPQE